MSLRPERGFTLLEALVALTIIGLAAIGTLEAFGAETRSVTRMLWRLEADALLEERIAVAQLLPRRVLLALPDSVSRGTFAEPFADFRWDLNGSPVKNAHDLIDLRITILHSEGSVTREARVFRPEPGNDRS